MLSIPTNRITTYCMNYRLVTTDRAETLHPNQVINISRGIACFFQSANPSLSLAKYKQIG